MATLKGIFLPVLLVTHCLFAEPAETISLHFEDAPIAQLFSSLATAENLNLVIDPAIQGRVTLHLNEVSWPIALQIAMQITGTSVQQKENVLILSKNHATENTLATVVRQNRSPVTGHQIERVFVLRYANAQQIKRQLLALPTAGLSPTGNVDEDPIHNRLVVWDDAAAMKRISHWIARQDSPQPQIEISAQIISISQENLRELGVSWQTRDSSGGERRAANPHFSTSLGVPSPTASASLVVTRLNSQLLALELSALEEENEVEIIASPRLVTIQGSTASIKQGTEIPYQTQSNKNRNPVVAFKEAVLGMQVTPELVGQQIKLNLHISQNIPGKVLQLDGKGPPSIDKQEITTTVMVADGQTLALGGIFQRQHQRGVAAVPFLGDIPGLKHLFRKRASQQHRRELVIFITPRLLYPSDPA